MILLIILLVTSFILGIIRFSFSLEKENLNNEINQKKVNGIKK